MKSGKPGGGGGCYRQLTTFRNGYVVYRIQEEVEEAAKVHSQIIVSFTAVISNLLDEVSESHIFRGRSDNPWAAAVVVVEGEEEMKQPVLHLILLDSFPRAPSCLHSVIPN